MLSRLLSPTTQHVETQPEKKQVPIMEFDLEEERQFALRQIDALALDDIYKGQLKQLKSAHHELDDTLTDAYIRKHFDHQTGVIFPIDISYLIAKYWSDYDVFDNDDGDNCYIHNTSSNMRHRDTVVGSTVITDGDRKLWEIAIVQPMGGIYIGIVDASLNVSANHHPFCFSTGGYGVCSSSGHFYRGHKKNDITKHYIQPFDDDDVNGKVVVIAVDLNLIDATLSFRFDDMTCPTAFKFDAEQRCKSYRLAVTLSGGAAVYLIK